MNSKDFIQKLMGAVQDHRRKILSQSWCLQDTDERKFRLGFVIELSVELARIRAISHFATGSAESVIEHIIEGEWARAKESVGLFRFEIESEELRTKYAPLWANFVQIAEAGCAQAKARSEGVQPS